MSRPYDGQTPAEQATFAREELMHLDEESMMDDYNDDETENNQSFLNLLPEDDEAGNDDPAQLFAILEDAINQTAKQTGDTGRALTAVEQQQKRENAEHTWDRVRRWMWAHPQVEQRQAAAFIRGQADATALHLMCKLHNPPDDIIQAIVDSAVDVVSWTDAHGWLPLHHACANGVSPETMKVLVDAYPAGKLQQDNMRRTPLHFYATRNSDSTVIMTTNTELLADDGAAELTDRGGMLPMHYACAYGTDPAVLEVLAQVYPASLTAKENKGRTPMHLAMVNAHRDASPNVIHFLLEYAESRATVNVRDQDGYLPLHLLALGLKGYTADESTKRSNVSACLSMYMDAEPQAAADFLTAIQDLPDWLQDTAVVSKHVRNVLNYKIVQPFPTSILMLDGYFLIVLIVCFAFSTKYYIDFLFEPESNKTDIDIYIVFLFIGASYFLMRELVQVASLVSLGSFSSWWSDAANWLDVGVITMVYYYAICMSMDSPVDRNLFRSGAAFGQGILYVAVIVYLKSTYVDFAVFVGGVLYVVQRLTAFLTAVGVILLAFAQMFYFIYVDGEMCTNRLQPDDLNYDADLDCRFSHCSFEESLLRVYSMMMGEIGDEKRYSAGPTSLVAQILYVGYAFLVVILLSNVLIAIVTDSYEIIQNDRAAIVFWTNRLDFVAEMDAITYGAQRRLGCFRKKKTPMQVEEIPNAPGLVSDDYNDRNGSSDFFRYGWQQVMLLFDANLYEEIDPIESLVYNIFRIACIVFVIPLWLIMGAATAGWLWPPQVREALFCQKGTTTSRSEIERKKLEQLRTIQTDLTSLKSDIVREMTSDRDEMIRMKLEVEGVQAEVLSDLIQVRELITSLLGT
jgi:ankyrin repeat protein